VVVCFLGCGCLVVVQPIVCCMFVCVCGRVCVFVFVLLRVLIPFSSS
jgi:hypothetical protein